MSSETVDYKRLIDADVTLWLMGATGEQLVKHGVALLPDVQWLAEQAPPSAGESAYSRLSAAGRIVGDPALIVLHSAAYHCPHLFERKAVAWIMKQTGGAYDPVKVRAVWNVVHKAKAEPLPDEANNPPSDSGSPPSTD